ncbi:MAG: hypothetical protein JST93_24250 [Acidobacteria bacterium]|nr:hypothetical protein [Acidobacteriota bacterium]
MHWALLLTAATLAGAPPDPRLISVYPTTGKTGSTFAASIRGNAIAKCTGVHAPGAPLTFAVEGVSKDKSIDVVKLRITVAADAKPGPYALRLITANGVSNALTLQVTDLTLIEEPAGTHETPETAIAISSLPVAFNGRIAERGESDYYAFQANAGDTLTFTAGSGLPAPGAPGGNARGFDPSLTLYEPGSSWFEEKRWNRIAFNDEPLWVIGRNTDAALAHRFKKAGTYLLRVEAFSGQGGPDYGYQLMVRPGDVLPPSEASSSDWEERSYTRRLSHERMTEIAARGEAKKHAAIETYRSNLSLPGLLEGAIAEPGETHQAKFNLPAPQDIAIEIETPETAPPLFNPVVRLLNEKGEEVATNVQAGRGACTGALTKSLQPKLTVPLRDTGNYTVEVREVTADLAGPQFRYRVLVRPQIPHIGQVRITEDHVNLYPGEAKTVRVVFDREEDFRGALAVSVEGLPKGVEALASADFEPDKDAPLSTGKRERYQARTERTVVAFSAVDDAGVTPQPVTIRLVARAIAGSKPGAVIARKEIPLMVVAKP